MNRRRNLTAFASVRMVLYIAMWAAAVGSLEAQTEEKPPRELQLIPLKHATAVEVAAAIDQLFGSRKDPSVQVVAEPRTNTLLVSAPSAEIEELKAMVSKLDTVPRDSDDGRQIKIFSLANVVPSSSLMKMLSVVDTDARVAFDPDRNLIVASGSQGALLSIEAFLERIDERSADQENTGEAVPQELQVRIVWLVGDLEHEAAKMPPPDLENVLRELNKVGVSDLEMVAQIFVNATEGVPFTANGSATFTRPCSLKLSGSIVGTLRGGGGVRAKSPDPRLQLEISAMEDGPEAHQLCALQTTITAPIGQSVVLGMTPIQSKPSVFIVQVVPKVVVERN